MLMLRLVRIPIAALAVAAVLLLVRALAGAPATLPAEPGPLGLGLGVGVLSSLLLLLVAGVGTVVSTYSARNLIGQERLTRFALLELGTVLALAVVVTSTNLPVLALGWTAATLGISGLVAHAGTARAREAARQVRARLLLGDALLWGAVAAAALALGTVRISELPAAAAGAPVAAEAVALLAVAAGAVRSALVPAHRWLPETAEAPSPVSALLHAGLVNGAGVLALLLWPLVVVAPAARIVLVVVGAASVLVAIAQARTRADVKGRLAASTSSQMGYLAMQLGLGVPAAAVAHVLGHGVWKASLFLGAGGAVERARHGGAALAAARPRIVVAAAAAAVAVVGILAVAPVGLPALVAPAELLALLVAVGVVSAALVAVSRARAAAASRALAAAVVLAVAAAYVLGLRLLTDVLAPSLGEPAGWGTAQAPLVLAGVVAVVLVALLAVAVDRRARAGGAPRLVRRAARASLRPWTLRERLAARPRAALVVPPVEPADAQAARHVVALASSATGPLYPLTSFVAANPVGGWEDLGFADACALGDRVWGAVSGPTGASVRDALESGRVRADDVDGVVTQLVASWPRLTAAGRPLDAHALVRSLLLHDEDDAALVAAAVAALERAALPGTRALRTPSEALGSPAAELDRRARELGHLLCARSLAGAPWPAEPGPWRELLALGPSLDDLLRERGAAEAVAALPRDPAAAIAAVLEQLGVRPSDRPALLGRLLARDPGWAAHLVWRRRHESLAPAAVDAEADDLLVELVAARLVLDVVAASAMARRVLGRPVAADDLVTTSHEPLARLLAAATSAGADARLMTDDETRALARLLAPLASGGLATARSQALEDAWRAPVLEALQSAAPSRRDSPAAQVVACIDVRSERLRRHLESTGPWDTYGAAGFFGIPVRHQALDGRVSERTPALLRPAATVIERPVPEPAPRGVWDALRGAVGAVESVPALALGWAEAAGFLLAPSVLASTCAPGRARSFGDAVRSRLAMPARGRLDVVGDLGAEALADAAAGFLASTGLTALAPVVMILGHGAAVTNNPHVAAYDCGACGGSAGDVTARVMADALNDEHVRALLRQRGIEIDDDVLVVAALHDTTRDTVELLDPPATAPAALDALLRDLAAAGAAARAERLALLPGADPHARDSARVAAAQAADWASPRPEWGLAGAGAIVVGPRSLTRGLDLGGHVFLQSYEPTTDPDGEVLEQLMAGPVVVAQWITAQYRAATIDPHRFGAGDKTTHNVLGGGPVSAVITGARGDLRMGLPWQAVSASAPVAEEQQPWRAATEHAPVRLLVVVNAAADVIDAVLARQPSVARLVTGEWIALCALDPRSGDLLRRTASGRWLPALADDAVTRDEVDAAA